MNWLSRSILFVSSLLFVQWAGGVRFRIPGWVLILSGVLSVLGLLLWKLSR